MIFEESPPANRNMAEDPVTSAVEPAVGDDERPETDDAEEEKNPGGDALADCGESLKGVTVLPKPRVAKSVMVDVLREHNKMLTLLRCTHNLWMGG